MKFYDSHFYNSKAVDSAGVINIDKESTVEVDNCIFDKISSTGTKLWFHDEYGSGDGGVIVVEKEARNVVIKNPCSPTVPQKVTVESYTLTHQLQLP